MTLNTLEGVEVEMAASAGGGEGGRGYVSGKVHPRDETSPKVQKANKKKFPPSTN